MSYLSSNTTTPGVSTQAPGFAGTGTYQVGNYQIDPNAFVNPAGTGAPEFNQALGQQLGSTNMAAPTLAPAALSTGGAANTLSGIGMGTIPGAAAGAAALQGQRDQQANLAAMGSARGTANPALANYQLGVQNAGVQQNTAQNAVTGAAQEQLGALGAAQQNQQFNAQQIQQQAIQQAQLEGQQRGLNAQQLQAYVAARAQQIAQSMQGAQAGQSLAVQNNLGTQGLGLNAFDASAKAQADLTGKLAGVGGGVVNSLGSAAIMSDRTQKTKIKPSKEAISKFLSKYGKL